MMPRIPVFILLLLPILPLTGAVDGARAQSTKPESISVLEYAHQLFEEGDLFRAAGEAKRFLFFYSSHPRAKEAKAILQKVEARMSGKEASESKGDFDPWRWSRPGAESDNEGAMVGLVRFYQDHMRTFKRPGTCCPSYPNCSHYAVQAMKKHGGFLGSFIYVDRFWREVTTAGTPPFHTIKGKKFHYDPLERNDYWLSGGVRTDETFEIP